LVNVKKLAIFGIIGIVSLLALKSFNPFSNSNNNSSAPGISENSIEPNSSQILQNNNQFRIEAIQTEIDKARTEFDSITGVNVFEGEFKIGRIDRTTSKFLRGLVPAPSADGRLVLARNKIIEDHNKNAALQRQNINEFIQRQEQQIILIESGGL